MSRKPLIIALLILTVVLSVVFGLPYVQKMTNERLLQKELQAGAIVIEETTVGTINGIRVGAGNLGEGYTDEQGIEHPGLSIQLFVLSGEKSVSIIAYSGQLITIGGKSYRVNRIGKTKDKNGWVSLLPVEDPEPGL